ncbi:hypothetical protein AAG747_02280 [Rapidithrix thailandica]|uniref:Uncharacterized protein n=1 Tax=Rapidithrix thailandica TaxID=413964 RepID=A0AAW9RP77_9BACT
MKFLFLYCSLLFVCFRYTANAQQTPSLQYQLDSVNEQVRQLQKQLAEEHYTRIPNNDFDERLEYKISNQMQSEFLFWGTGMIAFFGLIGGILAFAGDKLMNDRVEKVVRKELSHLKDQLVSDIHQKIKDVEGSLEKELSHVEASLTEVMNFTLESKKFIYQQELEKLRNEVNKAPNSTDVMHRLQELLRKAEEIRYETLIPLIVEELTYVYYASRKYKDLEKLISTYAKDYRLKETTLVNAALSCINDYESYGSKSKREKGLEYLELALDQVSGYGEAQGLKLQVYMIDYSRAKVEQEKNMALKGAQGVLDEIVFAYSDVSAGETLRRLSRDHKNKAFAKYVDLLHNLFPEEMKKMEERATNYNHLLQEAKSGN